MERSGWTFPDRSAERNHGQVQLLGASRIKPGSRGVTRNFRVPLEIGIDEVSAEFENRRLILTLPPVSATLAQVLVAGTAILA